MLASCSAAANHEEQVLRVSAASSLMEAMEAVQRTYTEEHPGTELVFSYGSSSKLRSQIEQGAPADLFLSASAADMELLAEAGLADEATIVPFASNRLVLAAGSEVSASGAAEDILAAADGTIAVGEPGSVPLGKYTKEALSELGIWDGLEDRFVYAKDARQVLTYTESGNADLGIVYSSDAFASDQAAVLAELPEGPEPIRYPGAVIGGTDQAEAAQDFLSFLTGEEGQRILEEHGFLPASGDGS